MDIGSRLREEGETPEIYREDRLEMGYNMMRFVHEGDSESLSRRTVDRKIASVAIGCITH